MLETKPAVVYERPTNQKPLSRDEKIELLRDYVKYYEKAASGDQTILNRKVPRTAFAKLLDMIGVLLIDGSERLANEPGAVRSFLADNPLPGRMTALLPAEFRVFCLALNSLKQWVSAEQSATDRYLLGGAAREIMRGATNRCLVTGESLGSAIELHHPLRDGRPPLPLSREGHARLENQVANKGSNSTGRVLVRLKRRGRHSWAQLRRGCLELLGRGHARGSANTASRARTFARKAAEATGLGYDELLEWLDANVS